ncbi:MAG: Flp family type IVb pilin [Roseibium sp.]|uniref:Flp family type IVb pilin n=1 Tax=Roseibium sp. TaxID=1936156 RepID=UPI0026190AEC|nr:Flp family type IVb pilin [Roseibium sp.]MCV0427247.1 Flp family type IVb pilin [Roseibium sp.]
MLKLLNVFVGRNNFLHLLRRFSREERAATLIEYGLIVGFISVALLFALTMLGTSLRDDVFSKIATAWEEPDAEGYGE